MREWLQNEATLQANRIGSAAKVKRIHPGCNQLSEELDMQVLDFLLDERASGRPVSNLDLQEKAVELARPLGLKEFKGSRGWLRRWKKRHHVGIRRGTNESQKVPEDYREKINDFVTSVKDLRQEHLYSNFCIGNMNQTMCRFDMASASTNEQLGVKDVRISTTGGAKRGYTVALCAMANGAEKPAMIVFKEPSGAIPPRVLAKLNIPRNVKVTSTKNGWMTGQKMEAWVRQVWGRNVDDVRHLLILDQARIHTAGSTKSAVSTTDTDLVFIPGGCTPKVQPTDVCWNAPFKAEMRRQYKTWRQQDLRTPHGNLKMAS